MDGITYSTLARNLALRDTTIWKLHYSDFFSDNFYGHPPLSFLLHSFLYKLFGDIFWVDRIFGLINVLLCTVLIHKLWIFSDNGDNRRYSFISLILWITTPIVFWSFNNNMIENSLSFWTLCAVFSYTKSASLSKWNYTFLGSTCVFMAFLTKGPVGMFPLLTIPIYYVSFNNISVRRTQNLFILAIFFFLVLLTILFTFNNDALLFYSEYFDNQLFSSLFEEHQFTTNYRFFIIEELLEELLLPIILSLILLVRRTRSNLKQYNRQIMFFLLLGLSASIPFVISLKQRNFYLVPSIPFFVLATSFLIISRFKIIDYRNTMTKNIKTILITIVIGTIVWSISQFGNSSRDTKLISDIERIKSISKSSDEIVFTSRSESICSDWKLIAYLARNSIVFKCNNEMDNNTFYIHQINEVLDSNFVMVDYLNFYKISYLRNFY